MKGATGGYLVGFIVAALLTGWLAQRQWDRRFNSAVAAMLTGSVVIYLFGLPWLAHVANLDLEGTLEAGLYPFVVGDLIKLYLAGALLRPPGSSSAASRVSRVSRRARMRVGERGIRNREEGSDEWPASRNRSTSRYLCAPRTTSGRSSRSSRRSWRA